MIRAITPSPETSTPALHNRLPASWLLLGSILVLTTLLLFKGITPSFSSDDYVHLENNIHYQSLGDALEVFTKPYGREYRPLVRLSLWWNHQLTESAVAYKITNIVLHLLCTLLVYGLLQKLKVSITAALIGTLLFAIHPIHTTSIHFILGRTDLVAALPYLACLLSVAYWSAKPRWWQILISFGFFVLALCAKELSITLPAMMLLIRWYQHPYPLWNWFLREQSWMWLFAIVSCSYLVIRWWMWRDMDHALAVYTNFSPINVLTNYVEWGFGILYPFDLYQAREWQLLSPRTFLLCAMIGMLCMVFLCWWLWWKNLRALLTSPLLWLGFAWILITLAPMAGGSAHRWYLYLPSAGLSMMLAAAWQTIPAGRHRYAGLGLFVILALFAYETQRQSALWETQHQITQHLLDDLETQGIHQLDEIYLINQPFGYQSTFLFSFTALEEAMRVTLGRSPKIHVISYLNLDQLEKIDIAVKNNRVHFHIRPNAYQYVMFSSIERYFSAPAKRTIHGISVSIDELDRAGRISQYHIETENLPTEKFYFFDGFQFKSVKSLQP